MVFRPAAADTGIVFERADLPGRPEVRAEIGFVAGSRRCTTLVRDGIVVRTVEHALAALHVMGVDNAVVELHGEELPVADGSAVVFSEMIAEAGLVGQESERRFTDLPSPVWVSAGGQHLIAIPAESYRVSYTFVSDHPAIGNQFIEVAVLPGTFVAEIASARTIGWLSEIEELKRQGLALGGSVDIAVVVGERSIMTPLRYADEIVRHKVLDLIGDLALVGRIRAHVIGVRSGHELTAELARRIRRQHDARRFQETGPVAGICELEEAQALLR